MIDNGSGKRQIEFLPLQTHVKGFEIAMLAISILVCHRDPGDRALYEHWDRVPSDRLSQVGNP